MLIIRIVAGKKPEGVITQREYNIRILNYPAFKLFIAAVFLLNFAVMIQTFLIGAYEFAARTLGVLLTMVVIIGIVQIGAKKGWSEKAWKMIAGLIPLVGLPILLWGYIRQ